MKYTTWSNETPKENGVYWHVTKTWEWKDDKWKFKQVSEPDIVGVSIDSDSIDLDTIGSDDPGMMPLNMVSEYEYYKEAIFMFDPPEVQEEKRSKGMIRLKVEHFLMKVDVPLF